MDVDVCVVGAGPAGASAAVTLARAGWRVALVDKARFPRDKVCGDALTTSALRQLEALGLDPRRIPSWRRVERLVARSPYGQVVDFPFPTNGGTFAAVAPRHELDAALVDLAREAGARVFDGHAFLDVTQSDDAISADIEGIGSIRASYLVAADGVWSPVAKRLGVYPDGYGGDCFATRWYFEGVAPEFADRMWFAYDKRLGLGYIWAFPIGNGRANVGWGYLREPGKKAPSFSGTWDALCADSEFREGVLGAKAQPVGRARGWPIATRLTGAVLTAGRAHFVGDAIGATDPATGEGIGQALLTGRLAAEAMIEAGPRQADAAARAYRRSVRRHLVPDHRISEFGLSVVRSPVRTELYIRAASVTGLTRHHFIRWLLEDHPRDIALSPHRWAPFARSLLRPPRGAFAGLSSATEEDAATAPIAAHA